MKKWIQIAIDGPVAAGKSTVAYELSKRLNLLYVDTGAMYRCFALAAKRRGMNWEDQKAMELLVKKVMIKLEKPRKEEKDGRKVTVLLDGEDVSLEIRSSEIAEGASIVGQYQRVRRRLVSLQKKISRNNDVVMEGRDIGIRVLPRADLKIYLDADLDTRVKRKRKQLSGMGKRLLNKEVREGIIKRDQREMTREVDPLRPAKGAWILDTSGLSTKKVVRMISDKLKIIREDRKDS